MCDFGLAPDVKSAIRNPEFAILTDTDLHSI